MPVTAPPTIDAPPPAPNSNSASTFDGLADAFIAYWTTFRNQIVAALAWLQGAATAAETAANTAITKAAEAADSEAVALAAANFKGTWASRTGAAAVPYSVAHLGRFWMLLSNLADVTTKVPGTDVEWQQIGSTLADIDVTTSGASVFGTNELCAATSAINRTLPASAPISAVVGFKDNGQLFATNMLTITPPTGEKIEDQAINETLTVSRNYIAFSLKKVSATVWRIF